MADNISRMLINYVPGEECRVAVVEGGKLEEFHAERSSSISRVGNIYAGKVTNVEASIQAAFVDFGIEHHGFLHVTDLHPRYFPGEDGETTERVGKKTPRRERPPIQRCLRRGDEITVQVLKEGVGTKGPTLTSYLSIPGRFLVMMPQMDRVGVSRKVEDEEVRRKMREVLDQLELPEGFGFIVRTAGLDRTKLELKRDLAYLLRLWKDMEHRLKSAERPKLLYSESDLLVRALRDMLGPEIQEVVVDNEVALRRAARFLKIVAPRSRVRLLHYKDRLPLYHAFGVEQQIATIYAREVPLPGGGRLVIDETEALVAIDVNSGKMREARDAETNAYKTNLEAVDEICRQLRLRDLGGIVINDLIDMRELRHRRDIEGRFRERLKRDRARSTTLAISEFGILEMTRQRMRGSQESVHFIDCPTCRGRGLVQRPDSIAADSLRTLAAVLDHEQVAKVELVVGPRVASELLSGRRHALGQLEAVTGKRVHVRVSETTPIDRVSYYAYDAGGADVDIERLPRAKAPKDMEVWEGSPGEGAWAVDLKEEEALVAEAEAQALVHAAQAAVGAEIEPHPIEMDEHEHAAAAEAAPAGPVAKKRRRRRRRGRRGEGEAGRAVENGEAVPAATPVGERIAPAAEAGEAAPVEDGVSDVKRRRRRRRRRTGASVDVAGGEAQPAAGAEAGPAEDQALRGDSWDVEPSEMKPAPTPEPESVEEAALEGGVEEGEPAPAGAPEEGGRKRRRRRRRRGKGEGAEQRTKQDETARPAAQPSEPAPAEPKPAKTPAKPPRVLYSRQRRLSPAELKRVAPE